MFRFADYLNDESGATAIEYGIIGVLISIIAIVAITSVGTEVTAMFEEAEQAFPD